MAKVKTGFFCNTEKRSYAVGDDYNGSRTDIAHLLEKETKELKKPIKKGTPTRGKSKSKKE